MTGSLRYAVRESPGHADNIIMVFRARWSHGRYREMGVENHQVECAYSAHMHVPGVGVHDVVLMSCMAVLKRLELYLMKTWI